MINTYRHFANILLQTSVSLHNISDALGTRATLEDVDSIKRIFKFIKFILMVLLCFNKRYLLIDFQKKEESANSARMFYVHRFFEDLGKNIYFPKLQGL